MYLRNDDGRPCKSLYVQTAPKGEHESSGKLRDVASDAEEKRGEGV